jgi:hypothetical protein
MDLLERVEMLERETTALKRRANGWRFTTCALIVLAVIASCRVAPPTQAQPPSGAGAGQPQTQKEVRTETLNVVDAQGHPRVVLGVSSDNAATLAMMDANGKPRMSVAVLTDGTALLTAIDTNEKPRTLFGVNNAGTPIVTTLDANGKKTDLTAE